MHNGFPTKLEIRSAFMRLQSRATAILFTKQQPEIRGMPGGGCGLLSPAHRGASP
jgi:hypothetical protein